MLQFTERHLIFLICFRFRCRVRNEINHLQRCVKGNRRHSLGQVCVLRKVCRDVPATSRGASSRRRGRRRGRGRGSDAGKRRSEVGTSPRCPRAPLPLAPQPWRRSLRSSILRHGTQAGYTRPGCASPFPGPEPRRQRNK